MGETRDVPVVLRLYDLVLWTMNHTARFPRHHRYSLGQRIEGTLQDLLELLIEARFAREKADLRAGHRAAGRVLKGSPAAVSALARGSASPSLVILPRPFLPRVQLGGLVGHCRGLAGIPPGLGALEQRLLLLG